MSGLDTSWKGRGASRKSIGLLRVKNRLMSEQNPELDKGRVCDRLGYRILIDDRAVNCVAGERDGVLVYQVRGPETAAGKPAHVPMWLKKARRNGHDVPHGLSRNLAEALRYILTDQESGMLMSKLTWTDLERQSGDHVFGENALIVQRAAEK